MRVHHVNCGTLCPYGARLIAGEGGLGRIFCAHEPVELAPEQDR
jgi:hypothetical protein